jgi:hypothetical protein
MIGFVDDRLVVELDIESLYRSESINSALASVDSPLFP